MIYDKTYQVLADGNYGLAVSEGSFVGAHTCYYDLFRVENGKIAEHWDIMEPIAPVPLIWKRTSANKPTKQASAGIIFRKCSTTAILWAMPGS